MFLVFDSAASETGKTQSRATHSHPAYSAEMPRVSMCRNRLRRVNNSDSRPPHVRQFLDRPCDLWLMVLGPIENKATDAPAFIKNSRRSVSEPHRNDSLIIESLLELVNEVGVCFSCCVSSGAGFKHTPAHLPAKFSNRRLGWEHAGDCPRTPDGPVRSGYEECERCEESRANRLSRVLRAKTARGPSKAVSTCARTSVIRSRVAALPGVCRS